MNNWVRYKNNNTLYEIMKYSYAYKTRYKKTQEGK